MMKKIRNGIFALILAVAGVISVAGLAAPVSAANEFNKNACNSGLSQDERAALGCDNYQTAPSVVTEIIKIIVSLLGIVAVLMILVAGQRYITSNGEPEKIKQARNMIIYSLVGLIIAGLAFAIVTFVQNGVFG